MRQMSIPHDAERRQINKQSALLTWKTHLPVVLIKRENTVKKLILMWSEQKLTLLSSGQAQVENQGTEGKWGNGTPLLTTSL